MKSDGKVQLGVRVLMLFTLLVVSPAPSPPLEALGARDSRRAAKPPATPADSQRLAFREGPPGELSTRLRLGSRMRTLSLRRHSVRADDFQVLVQRGGERIPVAPPPVRTWKGRVLEVPGSRARGSLSAGGLSAIIWTPEGAWSVRPVEGARDPGLHAVRPLSSSEVSICGLDGGSGLAARGQVGSVPLGPPSPVVCPLALDVDEDFFGHGQLGQMSVETTTTLVEALVHMMGEAFHTGDPAHDLRIVHEISLIVIRTDPATDPYEGIADPALLLDEVGIEWNTAPLSSVPRAAIQLLSGKDPADLGDVAGLPNGWALVCDPQLAYSFSALGAFASPDDRVRAIAHQLGHLWGAGHCNGCDCPCDDPDPDPCMIMCSQRCGVDPDCAADLLFNAGARAAMAAHRDAVTCLGSLADPLTVPFLETFPSLVPLGPPHWTFNYRSLGTVQELIQPTPPTKFYVLVLSGGPGPYDQADVRTARVLLSSIPDGVLTFYAAENAVETDGKLFVEYLDVDFNWRSVIPGDPGAIFSDGQGPPRFVLYAFPLPAAARHDDFRLRFRTEITGGAWYLDNIRITNGFPPDLESDPVIDFLLPSSGSAYQDVETLVHVFGENLGADAIVTFGPAGNPEATLSSLVWHGGNHISGTLLGTAPPYVARPVNVNVLQLTGSFTLLDGFALHTYLVWVPTVEIGTETSATVDVLVHLDEDIEAFSFGVESDPREVVVTGVVLGDAVPPDPDFEQITLSGAGDWWTIGVILNVPPGDGVIPSGLGRPLATATYDVSVQDRTVGFAVTDQVGNPPVDVVVHTAAGDSISPAFGWTAPEPIAFVRGDANTDGAVDVADAIYELAYLFAAAEEPACFATADVNDDAEVDVGDPIYLLTYLFQSGRPPPPPFPACGYDADMAQACASPPPCD